MTSQERFYQYSLQSLMLLQWKDETAPIFRTIQGFLHGRSNGSCQFSVLFSMTTYICKDLTPVLFPPLGDSCELCNIQRSRYVSATGHLCCRLHLVGP
jgi:hypothetical protein